ncbi:MAG: DUF2190 family protein [Candidatus Thiodiazotropha lotti]|uniref:DUF2190 family protein n=1 Tax=Candidatus Thiodiazotropha lotti TaxID=2792787 RepID=A0A9E4K619_9GAMM|nr:DUF2190 family protein [Candidatus Thiodiazotropha lotti]MCW4203964.1 DUF2190 family protein [Candidatus Thiodiazotropha lotti]
MRNEILVKTVVPGAAIAGYRVCKHGVADNTIIQSANGTDLHIGVSTYVGADPANGDETVDLVMMGIAEVEYGGNINRGELVTADANGRVVSATTGDMVIGRALASGVTNDIHGVLLTSAEKA